MGPPPRFVRRLLKLLISRAAHPLIADHRTENGQTDYSRKPPEETDFAASNRATDDVNPPSTPFFTGGIYLHVRPGNRMAGISSDSLQDTAPALARPPRSGPVRYRFVSDAIARPTPSGRHHATLRSDSLGRKQI